VDAVVHLAETAVCLGNCCAHFCRIRYKKTLILGGNSIFDLNSYARLNLRIFHHTLILYTKNEISLGGLVLVLLHIQSCFMLNMREVYSFT
jgi:hypothetical protein